MICQWGNLLVPEEEGGDEGESSGDNWSELGALVYISHPVSTNSVTEIQARLGIITNSGASS